MQKSSSTRKPKGSKRSCWKRSDFNRASFAYQKCTGGVKTEFIESKSSIMTPSKSNFAEMISNLDVPGSLLDHAILCNGNAWMIVLVDNGRRTLYKIQDPEASSLTKLILAQPKRKQYTRLQQYRKQFQSASWKTGSQYQSWLWTNNLILI